MKRHRIDRPLSGMLISDTAIKQPVLVVMIMLLLVVLGALDYSTMPVNRLPDIDLGTVVLRVTYPGAGPETIAEQVTKPVEDALTTVSGVKTISSNSSANIAVITVEFNGGVLTSTLLTLLLVPVAASLLQSVLDRLDNWKARRRAQRAGSAVEPVLEPVPHDKRAHEARPEALPLVEPQPRSNRHADVPLAGAATQTPGPQDD
jgi:hypothetical protein